MFLSDELYETGKMLKGFTDRLLVEEVLKSMISTCYKKISETTEHEYATSHEMITAYHRANNAMNSAIDKLNKEGVNAIEKDFFKRYVQNLNKTQEEDYSELINMLGWNEN